MYKKTIEILIASIISATLLGGLSICPTYAQGDYTKGYYQFPIKPGQLSYFAGTMGELRGTHFHAGLDIKTNFETGWPVYAAAAGHVSRISNQAGGYGYAIYLQHPNGHTTVYAHLEKLAPAMQRRMREEQYRKQQAHLNIYPNAGDFAFQKGQVIGYSGNSGYSFAPHLHFEIRDAAHRPLNPANFGFKEIKDNVPPAVYGLAMQPLHMNSYVNGGNGRHELEIKGSRDRFYVADTVFVRGAVGIEVYAYDRANYTTNKYGINRMQIWLGDVLHYEHYIDRVPFNESHFISEYINYPVLQATGRRYQRLYQTEGNQLPIYPKPELNGAIQLADGEVAEVQVRMEDSFGNQSKLNMVLKGGYAQVAPTPKAPFSIPINSSFQDGDMLYMSLSSKTNGRPMLHTRFQQFELMPTWQNSDSKVYTWHLGKGLPQKLASQTDTLFFHHLERGMPGISSTFYLADGVSLKTLANTFYVPSHLQYRRAGDTLTLAPTELSLRAPIEISFKPSHFLGDKKKTAIYRLQGKKMVYVGGSWGEEDNYTFSTTTLGSFVLAQDTEPPAISPISIGSRLLRFKVEDKMSGMVSFSASLNGKWLLMENDLKNNVLQSVPDDPNLPFKGMFRLEVSDRQGNTKVFSRNL